MAGEGCFRSGDFTSPPWRGKPRLTRRYRAARVGSRVAQTTAVAVCGCCIRSLKYPRTSKPADRATLRPKFPSPLSWGEGVTTWRDGSV